MGLGMLSDPAPDTFGLPEYKVTAVRGEIVGGGHDVRLLCGAERFGQMNWMYTVVVSPTDLLMFSKLCQTLAQEAFNLAQMMEGLPH